MKKIDLSLLKIGLQNRVFLPFNVLDLIYNPLNYRYLVSKTEGKYDTFELRWNVNNFPQLPTSIRKAVFQLIQKFDENNDIEVVLEEHISCVLQSIMQQTSLTINKGNCDITEVHTCEMEHATPKQIVHEIYLWHKWGLPLSKREKDLLTLSWHHFVSIYQIKQADEPSLKAVKKQLTTKQKNLSRKWSRLAARESFCKTGDSEFQTLNSEISEELDNLYNEIEEQNRQIGLLEIYTIIRDFAPEIII